MIEFNSLYNQKLYAWQNEAKKINLFKRRSSLSSAKHATFFDVFQTLLKLGDGYDASIRRDQACKRRSFTRRNLSRTHGINDCCQGIEGIGGAIHYW